MHFLEHAANTQPEAWCAILDHLAPLEIMTLWHVCGYTPSDGERKKYLNMAREVFPEPQTLRHKHRNMAKLLIISPYLIGVAKMIENLDKNEDEFQYVPRTKPYVVFVGGHRAHVYDPELCTGRRGSTAISPHWDGKTWTKCECMPVVSSNAMKEWNWLKEGWRRPGTGMCRVMAECSGARGRAVQMCKPMEQMFEYSDHLFVTGIIDVFNDPYEIIHHAHVAVPETDFIRFQCKSRCALGTNLIFAQVREQDSVMTTDEGDRSEGGGGRGDDQDSYEHVAANALVSRHNSRTTT